MYLDALNNASTPDRWQLIAEMAMRARNEGNARRPQPAGGTDGGQSGGGYQPGPSMREVRSGESALMRGHAGQGVRQLQQELNRRGANLAVDGKFGPKTEAAVRDFQARTGVERDGRFGRESAQALRRADSFNRSYAPGSDDPRRPDGSRSEDAAGWYLGVAGAAPSSRSLRERLPHDPEGRPQPAPRAPSVGERRPDGSIPASSMMRADEDRRGVRRADSTAPREPRPGDPPNRSAQFDRVVRNGGQRNQMVEGRITVNGNTYTFRSGGFKNGNLPPGDYTVTPHLWNRSDRSMNVDGVGYSFALSDKYDPRVGQNRSLLRIHPDGGTPGTEGCIGIVGNGDVQRRFREDMRAELARNGGRFVLSVR